jgi:hypothetical protein
MNMIKSTFPKWNAISINMPMICVSFKPFFSVASSSEHPQHEPDRFFASADGLAWFLAHWTPDWTNLSYRFLWGLQALYVQRDCRSTIVRRLSVAIHATEALFADRRFSRKNAAPCMNGSE